MPAYHFESEWGEGRRGSRLTEDKGFYLDGLAFSFAPFFFLLVCFSLHLPVNFSFLPILIPSR